MQISPYDALIAPPWLAANALLLRAAWRLVCRVFAADTLLQWLMHLIVICWSYIVVASFVVGSAGILSGSSLLAVVGGMAVATLVALRHVTSDHHDGLPGERSEFPPPAFAETRSSPERRWELAWGVVLAVALGMVVDGALLRFPTDWDSLMYHVPQIDQWLRAGSLYAPDSEVWYNPGNNELLGLWIVAPFSGDFLIGLGNLPAVALLALATVELARGLDLQPASCHLAGFAAIANYVVWRQLLDSENDVAAAALFIACLAYAVRYARNEKIGDLLFSAASLGLLAGVKYYALGYAGLAGLSLAFLGWRLRGIRGAMQAALAGAAGIAAFGGYWYLRNTLVGGAPLYPRGLSPSGDLLSEIQPDVWRSTLIGNGSPEIPALLAEAVWKPMGAAHLTACAAAPLAAAWLCLSSLLLRRNPAAEAAADGRLIVGLCAVGSSIVLAITPFAAECVPGTLDMLKGAYLPARFGLSFLTLAMVSAVVALDDLSRRPSARQRRWYCHAPQAAFAALAITQLRPARFWALPVNWVDGLIVAFNILLLSASLVLALRIWTFPRGIIVRGLPFLAAAVVATGWLGQRWHDRFTPHYGEMFHTEVFGLLAACAPSETRIGAMEYRYYPLFGSRRQFRVSKPLWLPSYRAFLDYLREHEATVVVTVNREPFPDGRFENTKKWLDSDPRRFSLLKSDHRFSAYRLSAILEAPE